jgi:dTDP-4-dehydrorhamnose reductase
MTHLPVVAVTGPRGLLGATLLRSLREAGWGSVALSADVRDANAVRDEVRATAPEWIVHTAAKTDVAACERDPENAHAVNARGTENVVDAAGICGARLIYISTVSVFSGYEGNYAEDARPEPLNVYNTTKRDGECATLAYDKGMVVRLNLVGVHPSGSRGKNLMEWLVESILANNDLTLFNDQFINPLSNWTTALLLRMIIEREIHERLLHLGSADVLSKASLARLVLARFPHYHGAVTEMSIECIADGVTRPRQMWLNTARTRKLLGIEFPPCAAEIETILSAGSLTNNL